MMKLKLTDLKVGEEVIIVTGVMLYVTPVKVVIIGEYQYFIALRAFFKFRDPLTGEIKLNHYSVTVSKASIYCGDAILRKVSDGEICSVEEDYEGVTS